MKEKIFKTLVELKHKGRRIIFSRWESDRSGKHAEGAFKYISAYSATESELRKTAEKMAEELVRVNADTLYISHHSGGHTYTRTIAVSASQP